MAGLKGVKFAYILSKNKAVIEPELNAVREASKVADNFNEFEKERIELNEKYAVKDKDGKPVIKEENYQISDKVAFDKELNKLKEKHKEAIEERENQVKEVDELQKEEIELELREIPLDIVPQDITVSQMDSLSLLIKE
jgi:antirestriction protein